MIILGVLLLILAAVAHLHVFWTIGIIVIIVGVVLAILGQLGHPVAGRGRWY